MAPKSIPPALVEAPTRARRLYLGASDHGTTETGMQILVFLVQVNQAAFIDVQRALELEQTRVSHAVRALKDATLVVVSPDPGNPRKRIIKPTRAGRARVRKFVRSVEPLLEAADER